MEEDPIRLHPSNRFSLRGRLILPPLPAQTIRRLGILTPCAPRTRFNGVTYGLGPAGYDLRIAQDVTLIIGWPKMVDAVEVFNMPNDCLGRLYTKSTWARAPNHVRVANTVIDPGWRGILRLELSLHKIRRPLRIKAGTAVVYLVIERLEEPTEQPYEGKYQDQLPGQDAIFEEGR